MPRDLTKAELLEFYRMFLEEAGLPEDTRPAKAKRTLRTKVKRSRSQAAKLGWKRRRKREATKAAVARQDTTKKARKARREAGLESGETKPRDKREEIYASLTEVKQRPSDQAVSVRNSDGSVDGELIVGVTSSTVYDVLINIGETLRIPPRCWISIGLHFMMRVREHKSPSKVGRPEAPISGDLETMESVFTNWYPGARKANAFLVGRSLKTGGKSASLEEQIDSMRDAVTDSTATGAIRYITVRLHWNRNNSRP